MNRLLTRDTSMLRMNRDDDEDGVYERQALIDEDELGNDNSDWMPNLGDSSQMRCRSKPTSNHKNDYGLEMKTRDAVTDSILEYTYYDIQPNDSLHSVCLRYACPVNQVKRINGLITDQEFYGLRRIKLPLGKFGLLEDVLNSGKQVPQSIVITESDGTFRETRIVNSPGSAMFISTQSGSIMDGLPVALSSSSSDRINDLSMTNNIIPLTSPVPAETRHNQYQLVHSHSFTSMSDLANNNNNRLYHQIDSANRITSHTKSPEKLIKSDTNFGDRGANQDLVTDTTPPALDHVGKVFENLDYHVERAKVAAQDYEQRAEDLVNRIDINSPSHSIRIQPVRVSKIPELFFCNENFGLSYKKLIVFIFVVCLIVPLIYVTNQTHVITTRLK